jgi:hypothetical protein
MQSLFPSDISFQVFVREPTMTELRARIESRDPIKGDISPASAIRAERDRR